MKDTAPHRQSRREPRVEKEVGVTLHLPQGDRAHRTLDVSYRGFFIVTEEPLPLRKLVRLRVHVDGADDGLRMLGLVAHRVAPTDATDRGGQAGMGIQLYGVGPEARDRWRHFVRTSYEENPEARQAVKDRELPRLRLRFRNVEELAHFVEHEIGRGNAYVRSADLQHQGARMWLELSHPETEAIERLESIVMEVREAPRQERGMRLMFLNADEDALERFVAGTSADHEETQ